MATPFMRQDPEDNIQRETPEDTTRGRQHPEDDQRTISRGQPRGQHSEGNRRGHPQKTTFRGQPLQTKPTVEDNNQWTIPEDSIP